MRFISLLAYGLAVSATPKPHHDIDAFIEKQTPIALEQLFCNVGPDGCRASEVDSGLIIASPSKDSPPYFFFWPRDSGLVMQMLIERFLEEYDPELQRHIENYIAAQAKIQGLVVPSGSLEDGSGLGEPKFNVNSTAFTGDWGRPQSDGPPLRAITMITYANWLIDNGYEATAEEIIWPILKNDLEYTAQYWNTTSFDIWEEIPTSSFFTVAGQHRALVEGTQLAKALGKPADHYAEVAPQILCFLQNFWLPEKNYINANFNTDVVRTGLDANTLLGSIHAFDPSQGCSATTFQPCSDRALSNHKAVVDSFRQWPINADTPRGSAVAVGRYIGDVYYEGNPWYLSTLAAAELLYDAIHVWRTQGYIEVTDISLPFFRDLVGPVAKPATFKRGNPKYRALIKAVKKYADGFIAVVEKNTPADGHLAEQFSKTDGAPLSAPDLTWSYASFLSATMRRDGIMPQPWGEEMAPLPDECVGKTFEGVYASATATVFPPSQTPTV